MSYHILHHNGTREGPFDLILLIKKVRNGRLKYDDVVEDDQNGEGIAAIMHPALAEVFHEMEQNQDQPADVATRSMLDLKRLCKDGFSFLQEHHGITVYSGLYVIASIVPALVAWAVLPGFIAFFVAAAAQILGVFALGGLLWMILRMHRGQPADPDTIMRTLKQRQSVLLRTSVIIGLLSYVGFLFFAVPGLFVLTFTMPALLLVMEYDMEPWEAIALSRRKIQALGLESIGVLFAMSVIGFVGGLFIFPPVLLLPIAMHAFAVVYDELFSELG